MEETAIYITQRSLRANCHMNLFFWNSLDQVPAKAVKAWNACLTNSIVYVIFSQLYLWTGVQYLYSSQFIAWDLAGGEVLIGSLHSGVSYSPVIKFLDDRCSFIFSFNNLSVFPNVFPTTRATTNSRFPRQSYRILHFSTDLCFVL